MSPIGRTTSLAIGTFFCGFAWSCSSPPGRGRDSDPDRVRSTIHAAEDRADLTPYDCSRSSGRGTPDSRPPT